MELLEQRIVYLKRRIVFPYCTSTIIFKNKDIAQELSKGDRIIACPIPSLVSLLFYKNRMATLAEIQEIQKQDSVVAMQLKGLLRVRLKKRHGSKSVDVDILPTHEHSSKGELIEELRKRSQELIFLINVEESDKLIRLLNYLIELNQLTDFVANYFILDFPRRKRLYTEEDPVKRAEYLMELLDQVIADMKKKQ